MMGSPLPRNGASDINAAPNPHRPSAAQAQGISRRDPFRLHNSPASAMNHTSTDRSTCTTSATRKKSATGSSRFTPGVRDSTSSTENRPETISASRPSHSQPRASAARASVGTGNA